MSRELSTTRAQVFGDVEKGTECRVCGRNVEDGRRKTCSDYCELILRQVMSLLNWEGVRRRVLERDDHTCVECGFKYEWIRRGRDHLQAMIDERMPPRPTLDRSLSDPDDRPEQEEILQHLQESDAWTRCHDYWKRRLGDPWEQHERYRLEVDHITPIADGGHPFDPANLQTLCPDCHNRKTALENSDRSGRKEMDRPEIKLVEFEEGPR